MELADLPQDWLALILSWTSPIDACRLACVSRAFAAAAASNVTWENLMPSDYRHIRSDLGCAVEKKSVWEILAQGVWLNGGGEKYKLLRRSGEICRILSVARMEIAWGNDSRFWRWEFSRSSCFGKVAHLIAVCWMEVTGEWSCSLLPGTYSVVWRLKVTNPRGGLVHFLSWKKPLKFSIAVSNGPVLEKELDLDQLPSNGFEEWFEFEVGKWEVKGKRREVKQLHINFFIKELDCSFWKGGLFLDCLTLRPSTCADKIYTEQHDKILSRVRGRTGVF